MIMFQDDDVNKKRVQRKTRCLLLSTYIRAIPNYGATAVLPGNFTSSRTSSDDFDDLYAPTHIMCASIQNARSACPPTIPRLPS